MNILDKIKIYIHKPDFVINISHGHARVIAGAVLARFIYSCNSISESHNINTGCIAGYIKHNYAQLKFDGIPVYLHSLFRNSYPG